MHDAAKHYGYRHEESLRRRLRQLREKGLVRDVGNPPKKYEVCAQLGTDAITIRWVNPTTAMISTNISMKLLNPRRGKRSVSRKSAT